MERVSTGGLHEFKHEKGKKWELKPKEKKEIKDQYYRANLRETQEEYDKNSKEIKSKHKMNMIIVVVIIIVIGLIGYFLIL